MMKPKISQNGYDGLSLVIVIAGCQKLGRKEAEL